MTWTAIIVLAVFSYAFKVLGFTVAGGRELRGPAADAMRLLPAALLAALVVVGTVTTDQALTIDGRLAGTAFAAFAVWRKWSFTIVVVGAAAVTALVRLLGA